MPTPTCLANHFRTRLIILIFDIIRLRYLQTPVEGRSSGVIHIINNFICPWSIIHDYDLINSQAFRPPYNVWSNRPPSNLKPTSMNSVSHFGNMTRQSNFNRPG